MNILSLGSCDFGPATLPRSYKGFGMEAETKKSHVTWSDTAPKSFRQSHEFLRSDISNSNAPTKRESVV